MDNTLRRVAVIITAFNRRKKTIECLRRLFSQNDFGLEINVYLTDDGSTDGTSDEVRIKFPQVKISDGNGSLYWAGGMNMSWERAVKDGGYDGYLWLNDDTILQDDIWRKFICIHKYCIDKYGKGGIYVGSTLDLDGHRHTYGGSRSVSWWRSKYKLISPNGEYQLCDIANGNITFVTKDVVDGIGCFYPGYVHGADYDYTYWAAKEKYPLLLLKEYVGYCDNDHKSLRESLINKPLKKRIEYLYSPTGMQLPTALLFQKRFYPHYVPLLFISYWFKALFPWILKK